jgi:eukaryotic-like serine/threonine-protein kinase
MEFPTAEEYIRAVQHPPAAFQRPELRAARFEVHPMLGIPVPASGTTAVVFKANIDGTDQALRFFTRQDASSQQRYTALNSYFAQRGLSPHVAACGWIDDAILVGGRRWPMVRMEWVDGHTLDQHVENLVERGDTGSLGALAGAWRNLVRATQAARFAHGDLQHGNVLVDRGGALRLVDFDSAWIEPFAGLHPPTEQGHRNYQHPRRVWGPWMDTFPGLVIYLSLLALARDPGMWQHYNGENLLFDSADFTPPHQSPVWWKVQQLGDPRVDTLASQLRATLAPTWSADGDLESLLSAPVPWWTRTKAAAGSTPLPAAAQPVPPAARPAQPPPRPGQWWSPPAPAPKRRSRRPALLVAVLFWLVCVIAGLAANPPLGAAVGAAAGLLPALAGYALVRVASRGGPR